MAEQLAPATEPQEVDEQRFGELAKLASRARLRARPVGDMRCGTCRSFLEPSAELSYCWHPGLRVLVGGEWWCQWWEQAPGPAPAG